MGGWAFKQAKRLVNYLNQASKISTIKNSDSEVYGILQRELTRESETLELIASENFVSYPILEMAGGIMTNKYAEGYPGARYYGGCQHVDEAENLSLIHISEPTRPY